MRFFAVFATAAAVSLSSSGAREFEDKFGRMINAELVAHTGIDGELVTIDKGGKQMRVKVALFSQKDQQFIREWMKQTPPSIDYSFRVAAVRKEAAAPEPEAAPEGDVGEAGREAFARARAGASAASELYEIVVTNLTRQTVRGLKVKYRLYMMDYPSSFEELRDAFEGGGGGFEALRRGGRGGGGVKPKLEHIEVSVPIEGALKYNESTSVETKPIQIHSGKNPLNGDRYKDEILGMIVRVYEPGGKMVFEHRDKKTEDFLWEVEKPGDEFGIRIE